MLEEGYRLESTQSQMLRSAMELGLLPRSIGHYFLKRSRESKRLGHQRNEPGKTSFEELCRQHEDTSTLRGIKSRASYVLGNASQVTTYLEGNNKAVYLRDLLQAYIGTISLLEIEPRDMMTSSI